MFENDIFGEFKTAQWNGFGEDYGEVTAIMSIRMTENGLYERLELVRANILGTVEPENCYPDDQLWWEYEYLNQALVKLQDEKAKRGAELGTPNAVETHNAFIETSKAQLHDEYKLLKDVFFTEGNEELREQIKASRKAKHEARLRGEIPDPYARSRRERPETDSAEHDDRPSAEVFELKTLG